MCVIADPEADVILTVTEKGFGKRSAVADYRRTGRGGQGVVNIDTREKNGQVVASFVVEDSDQLMMVTNGGQIIRIRVNGGEGDNIRIAGRRTQGVRLFEIGKDEEVVSVGMIRDADDEDEPESEEAATPDTSAAPDSPDAPDASNTPDTPDIGTPPSEEEGA